MSARFAVTKVAGDKELTDEEVFVILKAQMHRQLKGGTLFISVKATEQQIDKAMLTLMMGVGRREIATMNAR